ncbi:MAG: hypothetical protein KGD61_01725 [Candidatus Lokiarchaeota archaeon]|nr:hypothetical protein [Candidatus Lokiarchaeota archaeon]
MEDIDNDIEFSKYYRLIIPNEIDIDREEIFYRDKYNDIINYLKIMLTNQEESIVQSYNKFIQPKGAILINIRSGTDIDDYLKLISKNYYLNFYELNQEEIIKAPEVFINNFTSILENLIQVKETIKKNTVEADEESQPPEDQLAENRIKGILLINQENFSNIKLKDRNLLEHFVISFKNKKKILKNGLLLIWINNNIKEIEVNSRSIFEVFDLFIKIPLLDKIERETILRNFSEKNPKIVFDIKTLVDFTVNWEIRDINQLLKLGIFKHFLNSELNDTSNEITDGLIDLIESGEFIPSISHEEVKLDFSNNKVSENQNALNKRFMKGGETGITVNRSSEVLNQIKQERFSEFMLNQLYENAVSKNYSELLLIIDKLSKQELLEENDRKLLAKYAFILNDSPKMAQINLEKAKKRIDNLKRAFGTQ